MCCCNTVKDWSYFLQKPNKKHRHIMDEVRKNSFLLSTKWGKITTYFGSAVVATLTPPPKVSRCLHSEISQSHNDLLDWARTASVLLRLCVIIHTQIFTCTTTQASVWHLRNTLGSDCFGWLRWGDKDEGLLLAVYMVLEAQAWMCTQAAPQ